MTRDEMRQRMSAAEYQDWIKYYNTEPFGFPRRESRHGDLMASLWSLSPTAEKASKKLKTSEFWKFTPPKPISDDPDEEARQMMALMGG